MKEQSQLVRQTSGTAGIDLQALAILMGSCMRTTPEWARENLCVQIPIGNAKNVIYHIALRMFCPFIACK